MANNTDPAGALADEIAEQDLGNLAGGYYWGYRVLSWYLGNTGYVCTATVECMKNCQR